MGVIYYALCDDCREYINLDKFYSFCPIRTIQDIEVEDLTEYGAGFIYRSLRLHFFMSHHVAHRVGVYHEDDCATRRQHFTEVFHWPTGGETGTDSIDLRDRNAPRLVVRTAFGDVYLDTRNDGINCFRFVNGERVDTLLLPAPAP